MPASTYVLARRDEHGSVVPVDTETLTMHELMLTVDDPDTWELLPQCPHHGCMVVYLSEWADADLLLLVDSPFVMLAEAVEPPEDGDSSDPAYRSRLRAALRRAYAAGCRAQ